MSLVGEIITDTLKETQADFSRKWSNFRIMGFIWFWLACIPAAYLHLIKGVIIGDGFCVLTGIFILGIVGGKAVTSLQSAIAQINMK